MGPSVAGGPVVVHDVGHRAGVRHAGVARHRAPRHGRGRPQPRHAVPEEAPVTLEDGRLGDHGLSGGWRLGDHGVEVIGDRVSVVAGAGGAVTDAHHRASTRGVTIEV